MTSKLLFLAAGATLAAGGANAADAIVAAEPEAVEYVRVCDAYGSGYFYIPGTETCLKINGYARFQVNAGPNAVTANASTTGSSDWEALTRGQLQLTAKSDTEYGPLTGLMVLQTNADNASSQIARLDSAYVELAGLRAGLFYSWWDDGLSGETDEVGSKVTLHNSIRYQYETSSFYAGISVDELEDGYFATGETPNNVGVAVAIGGKSGAFGYQLTAGYDTDNEEGAVRAMGTLAIGPGTFGLAGVYSSGPNSYYQTAEWAVAAEYAIKATDKLKITPGIQYFGNYGANKALADFNDVDAWKAGVTLDYQVVDNFLMKATVQYLDVDKADGVTTGFFRMQRAF